MKNRDKLEKIPRNCQITIHTGPTENISAMATIDIDDLKQLVSLFVVIIVIVFQFLFTFQRSGDYFWFYYYYYYK